MCGTVAERIVHAEGYHWGGGCWNNNDVDDAPGEALEYEGPPRGEGPDCSGFVFKAWALSSNGTNAFRLYSPLQYIHGPFTANSFKSNNGASGWGVIPKPNILFWDVMASTTHIGVVGSMNADGTDLIFEAKGEAYGTNLWTRNYRSSSSYTAARRLGWAG